MPDFRGVLMHGVVSSVSPEVNQRRKQEIREIPNIIRRSGAMALHNLAVAQPELVANFFGLDYGAPTLEPIGSGGTSTVFALNDREVLKVNWRSMLLSPDQRIQQAADNQRDHHALQRCLGDMVLPHSTKIDKHPFLGNGQAIQLVQPFMRFVDPRLFADESVGGISATVIGLSAKVPNIRDQLKSLVNRSYDLYETAGLVPDILGQENLVLDERAQLMIIDGLPLTGEIPEYQTHALDRLNSLSKALIS